MGSLPLKQKGTAGFNETGLDRDGSVGTDAECFLVCVPVLFRFMKKNIINYR